jgi:RND family efflux transporter MFP subunit
MCTKKPFLLNFLRSGGMLVLALMSMMSSSGCEKKVEAQPVPPTEVTVSQPLQKEVTDYLEFTGNSAAFESVDLRARVKGFLKKINYTEGSIVKAGQLLFEIEPDLFQADVDTAVATLQGAEARLSKAKADLAIKQEMAAGNAASKLDVIQSEANVNTAVAEVAAGKASLQHAKINLTYTKIYAPIGGRIDKSRVDVGNLVGADGNTLLANIVQLDPIYVFFYVDEPTLLKFQARMIQRGLTPGALKQTIPMRMAVGESGDFAFSGKIDYADNQVDPATGTIRVRAVLPNPKREIAAGSFCRVEVPDGEPYRAILVPDRAIGVDQGQKYVLVVNDKNVVEYRSIEAGSKHGRLRVVTKGLSPGEWIVTEGLIRTRPGATVAPQKKSLEEYETSQPSTTPSTQSA